jgi:hypothetical protein
LTILIKNSILKLDNSSILHESYEVRFSGEECMKLTTLPSFIIAGSFAMTGCLGGNTSVQSSADGTSLTGTASPSSGASVCSPLVSSSNPVNQNQMTLNNGVRGGLYYFNGTDEIQKSIGNISNLKVNDFFTSGHKANIDLFFTDFSAPPQSVGPGGLTPGFKLSNGNYLKKDDGTNLYEYFAFKFEGQIQLPPGSTTTYKEFALITDDGAILDINNGFLKINNDGLHCSVIQ